MSRSRRRLLRIAGLSLVGAGTVGIVVPLWPTTCFYLGAIWCFSRSAPEWVERLYRVPVAGPALRGYVEDGEISGTLLRRTGVVLWAGLLTSWILLSPPAWVGGVLLLVGASVTVHLIRLSGRSSGAEVHGRLACPHHTEARP